jgi:hypothetical protein
MNMKTRLPILIALWVLATLPAVAQPRALYVQHYATINDLLTGPRTGATVAAVSSMTGVALDDGAVFYYDASSTTDTNTTTVFEPSYGGRWLRSLAASGAAGEGDVTGPGSSTLYNVPVFGSTDGKVITSSGVTLSGTGLENITAGTYLGTGQIRAGSVHPIFWNTRSRMWSGVDGNIHLTDAATNTFNRLGLGPTTTAFPSLKVEAGPELRVEAGDGSAYADLRAAKVQGDQMVIATSSVLDDALDIITGANQTAVRISDLATGPGAMTIDGGGMLEWGDGVNAVDTQLYRHTAGLLRTSGDFTALGDITATNVIAEAIDLDGTDLGGTLTTISGNLTTVSNSVVTAEADIVALETSTGPAGDWNVTGDITATGSITASGGIASGGSGDNSLSTPLVLHTLASTNIYFATEIVSGASTNGTNVSLWSRSVGKGEVLSISSHVAADSVDEGSLADVLSYSFKRPRYQGATGIGHTNHLRGLTNHWFEVESDVVTLYTSAELDEVQSSRAKLEWVVAPTATSTFSPLYFFDFEGEEASSGWGTFGATGNQIFDYSTNPLEGDQSLYLEYGSDSLLASYPLPAADEYYVAGAYRQATSGANAWFAVAATGVGEVSVLQTTGTKVLTTNLGGTTTAGSDEDITFGTSGPFAFFKLRVKIGTGANAEVEVWFTNDITTGWGTSKSTTNGTNVAQFTQLRAKSTGRNCWFDIIAVSTSDIPASFFQ